MTVRQLRQRIDGAEWLDWWVYYARKAQRQELEALKGHG
jgi:hypothetical protein